MSTQEQRTWTEIMILLALLAVTAIVALLALRWGDPALPRCPENRTAHVRCAP